MKEQKQGLYLLASDLADISVAIGRSWAYGFFVLGILSLIYFFGGESFVIGLIKKPSFYGWNLFILFIIICLPRSEEGY